MVDSKSDKLSFTTEVLTRGDKCKSFVAGPPTKSGLNQSTTIPQDVKHWPGYPSSHKQPENFTHCTVAVALRISRPIGEHRQVIAIEELLGSVLPYRNVRSTTFSGLHFGSRYDASIYVRHPGDSGVCCMDTTLLHAVVHIPYISQDRSIVSKNSQKWAKLVPRIIYPSCQMVRFSLSERC